MASNPFFVQSASYAPALRGLQDTLTGLRQEKRIDEEMSRRNAAEDRALEKESYMEGLRREALGLGAPRGIVADQQQDMPLGEFSTVLNPESVELDNMMLGSMGIDSPEKYAEVSEFADSVEGLPDSELDQAIKTRIEQGVAEGRDMRDTAELLTMPPQEQREMIQIAGMAVDNQILRQMYAKDPKQAAEFIGYMQAMPQGGGFAARVRDFEQRKDYVMSLPPSEQYAAAKEFGIDLMDARDRKYQKLGDTLYEETPDGLVEVARDDSKKMEEFYKEERKAANETVKSLNKRTREIESAYGKAEGLLNDLESGEGGRQTTAAAIMNIARLISPGVVTDADFRNLGGASDPFAFMLNWVKNTDDPDVKGLERYFDPTNPDNVDVAELRRIANATAAAEVPTIIQQLDDAEARAVESGMPEKQRGTIFKGSESIRSLGDRFSPQNAPSTELSDEDLVAKYGNI